jgi:hypothetical protein
MDAIWGLRPCQCPFVKLRRFYFAHITHDAQQISLVQIGLAQISPAQISLVQISPSQISPAQISLVQISPSQISPAQISLVQISPSQISLVQIGLAQISPSQMSPAQISPAQISPAQISMAQISSAQLSPLSAGLAPHPHTVQSQKIRDSFLVVCDVVQGSHATTPRRSKATTAAPTINPHSAA